MDVKEAIREAVEMQKLNGTDSAAFLVSLRANGFVMMDAQLLIETLEDAKRYVHGPMPGGRTGEGLNNSRSDRYKEKYTMGLCGDCKHWKPLERREWSGGDDEPENLPYDRYRECGRIPQRQHIENRIVDVHDLETPNYAAALTAVFDSEMAYTEDGSDYVSVLRTRAEFGCVLHEKKED